MLKVSPVNFAVLSSVIKSSWLWLFAIFSRIKSVTSDRQVVVDINNTGHGVHFRRAGPRDKVLF